MRGCLRPTEADHVPTDPRVQTEKLLHEARRGLRGLLTARRAGRRLIAVHCGGAFSYVEVGDVLRLPALCAGHLALAVTRLTEHGWTRPHGIAGSDWPQDPRDCVQAFRGTLARWLPASKINDPRTTVTRLDFALTPARLLQLVDRRLAPPEARWPLEVYEDLVDDWSAPAARASTSRAVLPGGRS